MKSQIVLAVLLILVIAYAEAQSRVDTLMELRKTEVIEGDLKVYYTSGHREIAKSFQEVISEAMRYYEVKYSKKFNVKLAVLDSTQWLNEVYGYGFVFYSNGWIVMNAGMRYESFQKVYGLQSYLSQLNSELRSKGISERQLMDSFFKFLCIHELGHYFFDKLSGAKAPDRWTNEFMASYFSYEFFMDYQPSELIPFELFCQVDRDFYSPTYSSIADFNEKYANTGLENYLWYHSNFYFLVKELFACKGTEFVTQYEKSFPREPEIKSSANEIILKLDLGCNGLVAKWVENLERK